MDLHIDFGPLVQGIVDGIKAAFEDVLTSWTDDLAPLAGTNGQDYVHKLWTWLSLSGLNFVVHTPINLVTTLSGVMGPAHDLIQAAAALAIVLAGISYIGHTYWGWAGLGESVQRIIVAIILAGAILRIEDWSLQAFNGIVEHGHVNLEQMPGDMGGGLPSLVTFGLLLVWVFLALRLAFQMGRRLIWLIILYPLGVPAAICWVHPKSAWITSLWTKLWLGWLVGQLLVVLALMGAAALVSIGGPGGYILSAAALLVAYDVVHVLAPKDGGFAMNVGVGPLRLSL